MLSGLESDKVGKCAVCADLLYRPTVYLKSFTSKSGRTCIHIARTIDHARDHAIDAVTAERDPQFFGVCGAGAVWKINKVLSGTFKFQSAGGIFFTHRARQHAAYSYFIPY